jgi:release factor glutamine methyltransferase
MNSFEYDYDRDSDNDGAVLDTSGPTWNIQYPREDNQEMDAVHQKPSGSSAVPAKASHACPGADTSGSIGSSSTVGEALAWAKDRLAIVGLTAPGLDAELLLSDVLGIPRLDLYAHRDAPLPTAKCAKFADFVVRREQHEPVQYILGTVAFHGIDLEVGPGVLVPRPETEILVEWVLAATPSGGAVLDLGTGSGAVALAVAAARSDLRVTGIEASPDALAWAVRNRARLGLGERVELLQGDLFSPVTGRKFNVIAANLPYIREDENTALPCEVRNWEPESALFAGVDGLTVIRRAIAEALTYLHPDGFLFLEITPAQREAVAAMAKKQGSRTCRFHDDLTGRLRFAELRW